ncbi:MAG TPA: universal stress protein [Candidatus Limnocylindrales bacterium]
MAIALGPVVVGVDGSGESMAALEWAATAANDRGAELRILHAGVDTQVLDEAQTFARAAGAHVEVTTLLVDGDAGETLVRMSERAGLVVVASHGHSRIHDTFATSVALHTAMHAHCPVVVIRPYKPAVEGMREAEGRVLLGVDGSEQSPAVVAFAFAEAQRLGVGVTALHTWIQPVASGHDSLVPLATDLEALQHENEAILSEAVAAARADHPDVDVRQVIMQTGAGAAIIDASMGARLVVIGSRGRGPVTGLLLGSTSQAVLHHAGCPVAVVHSGFGGTGFARSEPG